MKPSIVASVLVLAVVANVAPADDAATQASLTEDSDVVWTTHGNCSANSMPAGNGDVAVNVWTEEDGGLLFYVAKMDAWSEDAQLLKLGLVRVKLKPNPFQHGQPFSQRLRLQDGTIVIEAGQGSQRVSLHVRVDANHPVVQVDAESPSPFEAQAELVVWRSARRELKGLERDAVYGLVNSPTPVFVEPDCVVDGPKDRVIWYHRNERSIWADNLKLQALDELARTMRDPLLHRTFGGEIRGDGMIRTGPTSLQSAGPARQCRISVYAYTGQTETPDVWRNEVNALAAKIEAQDRRRQREDHDRWWCDFWNRSWIRVDGDADAEAVTRGYVLQRFINACAGRGAMPIKFNGSLFTMDCTWRGQEFNADFRQWGGPYWFQNTRLPYWSMLAAGDFDLMSPLFRMYRDTLPLAKFRTRRYYRHDGAFWPETIYFWGTYVNDNYGWDRQGKPDGLTDNRYIRYYWQSSLELVAMMLDHYAFTEDEPFLRETLLPLATEIVTFYDQHYRRDDRGRIRFEPAQSLETYWDSINPAPEIAGLQFVLQRLLALPDQETSAQQRQQWGRMLNELPPLPTREVDGQTALGFAEQTGPKSNSENPELYAVFPFRLYGVDKPDLKLALHTFEHRVHKRTGGWQQNAIQAALLGLGDEAAGMVAKNFSRNNPACRFPAFWGPNFDWTPDQDHGTVAMIALQQMLLQADGGKLHLLPAWPKRWNATFKLHAPGRTVMEGEFRDGTLRRCEVSPPERAADLQKP